MVRTMLHISHLLYFAEGYLGLLAFQRIPPEREKGTLYALVQQGGVRTHLQITSWGISDLILIGARRPPGRTGKSPEGRWNIYYLTPKIRVPLRATQADAKRANAKK